MVQPAMLSSYSLSFHSPVCTHFFSLINLAHPLDFMAPQSDKWCISKKEVLTMLSKPNQEIKYRLAKWIIANLEARKLLAPDEIETIWQQLLTAYEPPTRSVEVPCGSMLNPMGGGNRDGQSH